MTKQSKIDASNKTKIEKRTAAFVATAERLMPDDEGLKLSISTTRQAVSVPVFRAARKCAQ